MRRVLLYTVAFAALGIGVAGCGDQQVTEPAESTTAAAEARGPGGDGCLSPDQQSIADGVRSDIERLLVGRGGQRPANAHIDNIERKLCQEQYDDALEMAWGFLGLMDEKTPDQFNGGPADAAALGGDVFRLVAASPNTADPVEIPAGVFEPTGGLVTLDPAQASPDDPLVAATRNGEAALVVTSSDVFPPGTGPVTIALSRAPASEVTPSGAYIPGFQAFEQGYDIVSSHQPSSSGPGALIALCAFPPEPVQPAIGHLHESDVSLLVPAGDPEAAGYIDCAGAPGADGLAGRTRLLSSSAPVDPTILVGETAQLSVGTDAAWSSDDEGVATVDANGLVTGVGEGSAVITATFGSETETITVAVKESAAVGRITFASGVGGGEADIYVMDTDGTGRTNLTSHSAQDDAPNWSPDGSRIAFLSNRSGEMRIYTMNADGTGLIGPLGISPVWDLAWSPDGSQIAYIVGDPSPDIFSQLILMQADGSGSVVLGLGKDATHVDWSPDGSRFVVSRLLNFGGQPGSEIAVFNVDGSGTRTSLFTDVVVFTPKWSPDGTQILFSRSPTNTNAFELRVMGADGTGVTALATSSSSVFEGDWSSDGSRIVYTGLNIPTTTTEPTIDVYIINADGTGERALTDDAPAFSFDPDWQP